MCVLLLFLFLLFCDQMMEYKYRSFRLSSLVPKLHTCDRGDRIRTPDMARAVTYGEIPGTPLLLERALSVRTRQSIRMSLAVAIGPKQYVFRRNYSTRTWESLPGDGKACKVQVIKRSGSGEHILRITPENGEVGP